MKPDDAALLASVRAEVASGAHIVVVRGRAAIFTEDIVSKTDDELLAFIAKRLNESTER